MAKISVVVHRDENLFPRRIEITKGRKKLKVRQTPSPLGDSYSIDFEGRRDVLPSFPEILSVVNAKRLDRIGTIELIDEVSLLKVLEELTLLKKLEELTLVKKIELVEHATIDEITTIRDLTHAPRSLIMNPFWYQGFAGWQKSGTVSVIEEANERMVLYFVGSETGSVTQDFPVPIGVDWLTDFFLMLKSGSTGVNLIHIYYYYTDGTDTDETFQVATGAWEKKTLSPTAGKYIKLLRIYHDVSYDSCYVGWLTTVLANPL